MTILEYASQQRDASLKAESQWGHIIEACSTQGYYVIPAGLFRHSGGDVVITVHGYPDPMEQNRYMHRHDFFELVYVYQGSYCSRMEDRDIDMRAGDLLLLNTNVLHSPYLSSRDDIVFNILMSKQLVQDQLIPMLADNALLFSFFYNCLHSGTPVKESMLFRQVSRETIMLANQLVSEQMAHPLYYHHTMSAMIMLLLLCLSREHVMARSTIASTDDNTVFEIKLHEYLDHHLSSASLSDAAEKLTYTPAYLSRKVRQLTGITFSDLLTDYRIRKACELLRSTDLPLDAIAKAVGYVNASHFIRKFKERKGVTPGDYRKEKSSNLPAAIATQTRTDT